MRKRIILSAISLTFVFQSSGFAASLPVANPMVDQPQASVCQMDLSKTNSYWAYLFLDQNRVPPECLPGVIDRLTSKLAFFLVRDGRVPNGYEQEVWSKVDWKSLDPFLVGQLVFNNRVPEKYKSFCLMNLSEMDSYSAYFMLGQDRVPPECLSGVIDRLTPTHAFILVRDGRVPNGYEQEVWAKVDWVSLEPFEARQLVFHNRVPEKYESLIMDKSNAFVPGCREFQYWLESGYLDSSAPLCLHR